MAKSNEHFASGNWRVKAGSEDEFIARWTEFLEWTRSNAPGFVTASLIRQNQDPRHFVSFAEWEDTASRDKWRSLPEFAEKLGACRALCDEFQGLDYSRAVHVTA